MPTNISDSWRRQGDRLAADPGQWKFHASLILGGAEACWERYNAAATLIRSQESEAAFEAHGQPDADLLLLIPAHLLAAIGVELLLKALALKHRPDLATTGERPFYTHNLRNIAHAFVGMQFAVEELTLLDKLGTIIEWSGRYPTPRWDAEKHRMKYDVPVQVVEGQTMINAEDIPGGISDDSWRATVELIGRLQSAVEQFDDAPLK
jgi:hypothetical protein